MSPDVENLLKGFKEIKVSTELQQEFEQVWKPVSFNRRVFITEAGRVERYFYYVLAGVQALYIIDRRGEKVVLGFSYAGNFSGVYDSFIHERPSSFFLEALTPSKMLAVSLNHYNSLFQKFPEMEKWGRIFYQNILLGRVSREVELLTLPASERYRQFMQRCPPELHLIPQKYLASYLNMTPETFSRLRAKVDY